MPPFAVRPALPADAAAVAAQMLALWPDASPDEFPPELDAVLQGISAGPPRALLVAEADGVCIGFVGVGSRAYAEGCDTSPVAFLEGWYVEPAWRRQGVGTALVRAAEDWARRAGFAELGSDTWIDNQGSITAHKAAGFQEVERIVCFAKRL